jgi:hypothetical protein
MAAFSVAGGSGGDDDDGDGNDDGGGGEERDAAAEDGRVDGEAVLRAGPVSQAHQEDARGATVGLGVGVVCARPALAP